MKYSAPILASLLLAVCVPSQGGSLASAGPPVVRVDETSDFLAEMRKAMSIGASDQIIKLVRRNEQAATWAALSLCEANSMNPSDRLEDEINALRLAWNSAMKTRYVENVYEYYSFLDRKVRVERSVLVKRFQAFTVQLAKAEAAKDLKTILKLAADFRGVAEGLEATGDHYYASSAWIGYFSTQDVRNRGKDANLDQAAMALAKAIEHREALDLKDKVYSDCQMRYATLTRLGHGPGAEEAGEAGPAGPKNNSKKGPASPVGEALSVPLNFHIEPEIASFQRPIWSNDEVYNAWSSIYFAEAGASSVIGALEDASVLRTGPVSFELISGENKTESEMNGKFVPIQVTLKGENGDYPWGFLAIIGTRQDLYQGVTVNMEPAEEGLSVFIAPAAVLAGVVGETPIEVFDDTMSGKWGDEPKSWEYVGLSPGKYQQDLDSIRIDGSKKALPWSRLQKIGGAWYDLQITDAELTAQPVQVKTGTLKLKFKGPKPRFLILRGTGNLKDSFFDLASAKTVEVPIGQYELFAGMIAKGKRNGVKKILIQAGEQSPTYSVASDEETLVTLGGPFGFDFDFQDLGETIKIIGASIVVTGVAGERYERPWNARPHPEVSVRKAGAKRGGKAKRMQSNLDQDLLYSDWSLGYHPQDLELVKPKGAEAVEVQMAEKKNALFGSLQSVWKGES